MYRLYINRGGKTFEPVTAGGVVLTSRNRSAAVLDFVIYCNGVADFEEGDAVLFCNGYKNLFCGRIISMTFRCDNTVSISASDNIYYLRSKDSYNFVNCTLSQIVRMVVSGLGLPLGEIDETVRRIPFLCAPDSTTLGIIEKAIYEEQTATGQNYALFCVDEKICLKNTENMKVPIVIGSAGAGGFVKATSIDSCYNKIKLSASDAKSGIEKKHTKEDKLLMDKWGTLQYHEKVNAELNLAARADELLKTLGQKKIELTVSDAAGHTDVRAGSTVTLSLTEYGLSSAAMVTAAKHTFSAGEHLMTLNLQLYYSGN